MLKLNQLVKKLKNTKVLVLYGGTSSERKISIKTGTAIYSAIKSTGVKTELLDVDENIMKNIYKKKFDIALIALHGRHGEDGVIQSVLEILNKPYCGSNVLSSALCMNKYYTKIVFDKCKIPTPPYEFFRSKKGLAKINLPTVIKPVIEGSSIGLSIVKKPENLKKAINTAFKYNDSVLVEKFIPGRELTVGVIDDGNKTIALPVIEIKSSNEFFDFECKYTKGKTVYEVPANITENQTKKAMDLAVKSYEALNCRGMARIDIILSKNKMYVLEINTIPGMTETSLLPMAAAAKGINFERLVLHMIYTALKKW